MTHPTTVPVTQLPDTIRSYLAAHAARDVDGALGAFARAAEVVDQGITFQGTAAIRTFLGTAGAEFHYTTQRLGAERVDDAVWVAHNRIEGDFPGGVADLRYRFQLANDRILRLEITA
jgi:hypothetical protein